MAIYRTINMTFWTDCKVVDDFTPEDKYFYLYLMTNPHTNLCGCYEISLSQMATETGYNKDTIERLLTRFSEVHNVIRFSKTTKEIWIMNWSKYNWTRSEKFLKPLRTEVSNIKDKTFREQLTELLDTVSIPYAYGMDTTVTDTVYISNSDSLSSSNSLEDNGNKNTDNIREIIDYLNLVCNTHYTYRNKQTNKHISARLSEGHTIDEFKDVIDKKAKEWIGTDMEKYLCPDTLFGIKFEKYLNQKTTQKKTALDALWEC